MPQPGKGSTGPPSLAACVGPTRKSLAVASGLRQQAPTRSKGGLLLALTLAAGALSLSAPDGLPTFGARRDPMASTLMTRESWLEALRMRLAITLGVGGVQGTTVLDEAGRLCVGNCLEGLALLPESVPPIPPFGTVR